MLSIWSRTRRRPCRTGPGRLRQALRFSPRVEALEERSLMSAGYFVVPLVSDQAGMAPITDPNLVNPWGIAMSGAAFWVSDNGTGKSTIYSGDVNGTTFKQSTLVVSTASTNPTGQVFNPFTATNPTEFVVSDGAGHSGPATFLFASQAGIVSGWNFSVPPPPPSTTAEVGFTSTTGAAFTGMALGTDGAGQHVLYLADIHNNKIDVLNTSFQLTTLPGTFTDPKLPAGYAPFNVAVFGTKVYVTYALQNGAKNNGLPGAGAGYVDVYDVDGHLLNPNLTGHLISKGALNAPWGMAIAPANFGRFSKALLVGNFGNGWINAYNAKTGAFLGSMDNGHGVPVVLDGLWGLTFGNGKGAGDTNALYFAAGPTGQAHGLFGKIMAATNLVGLATANRHILNFDATSLEGLVAITNVSGATISGPITIELSPPPSSVTLADFTGVALGGNPYITIHVTTLAPGQTVEVPILLQGSLLSDADYFESFTVSVFSGPFSSS